jgi:hypothetical protein
MGCGLQTYEMLVGPEISKNALGERNWSASDSAVDPRDSRRDMRLLLSRNLTFVGITHVRGHEPSLGGGLSVGGCGQLSDGQVERLWGA